MFPFRSEWASDPDARMVLLPHDGSSLLGSCGDYPRQGMSAPMLETEELLVPGRAPQALIKVAIVTFHFLLLRSFVLGTRRYLYAWRQRRVIEFQAL